jgi:16S rRNA (guanine(966)-N(2))-methyltransferase RsmD
MRVAGGTCKGRRLASFRGRSIRPTSDKVREAVFDMLPGYPGCAGGGGVLDLFAGTGAMGIEAMSRGAARAVFVDSDAGAVAVIRKNLDACGLSNAVVMRADALAAIRALSRKGEGFSLIFIDPPYGSPLAEAALAAIDASGVLAPGGVAVAETSRRSPLEAAFKNLKKRDERRYGDTIVYFFVMSGA